MKQKEFLVSIKEDFYSRAKKIVTLGFTLIIVYLFINDFLVYKNVFHLSTGSFLENYLYAMDLSKAPYVILLSLVILIFFIWIIVLYSVLKNLALLNCKPFNFLYSFVINIVIIYLIFFMIKKDVLLFFALVIFSNILILLISCSTEIVKWFFLYVLLELHKVGCHCNVLYLSILINIILYSILFALGNFYTKEIDNTIDNKLKNNPLIFIILIISFIHFAFYMIMLMTKENYNNWYKSAAKKDFSFNLFLNTAFIKKTKTFNLENNNSIILNAISPDCNISKITLDSCYIPFSSNEKIFFQKADDFNNTHRICVVILQLKEVQYNFFKKFNLGDKDLINKTSNYEILDIGYIEVDKDKRDFNLCKGKK